MPRKWSEARERGIRQKTLRTFCRLNEQMANHPTVGLREAIIQATGWQKRKAYDYAKALALIRRTQGAEKLRPKDAVEREELSTLLASMDKRKSERWPRSFRSEWKWLLKEALGQSKESEKALESVSPTPSIGFDNLTDMSFMKRTHIYVMSLTCPYGKKEISYVPCPYPRFEEELAEVCTSCPKKKHELPLSEWKAKVRMTVPSNDLPRFLGGLTKEINNILEG